MSDRLFAYLFVPRLPQQQPASSQRGQKRAFQFEAGDGVVLGLYLLALCFAVWHHRPWIDEAQAWLLAKDDSTRDLLLRRLHYEGAPALWHLLLKGLIALHVPYAGLNWAAAALAVPGIVLWLGCSPFPRVFRWLLPFTFFLQYQYAALARPYVLFPGLLFLLCVAFSLQRPRPVLVALCAGLLVNVNAHTAILSSFFVLIYLQERWKTGDLALASWRRRYGAAGFVFLLFCAAALFVAFPAPDAMVIPSATGKIKSSNALLRRLIPPETLPPGVPPLDAPALPETQAGADVNVGAGTAQPAPVTAPPERTFRQRLTHKLQVTAQRSANLLTFPIAESNWVAVAFLVLLILWLASRRALITLLPWLLTIPLAAFIWVYDHHSGIFALALVAAIWLTLRRPAPPTGAAWTSILFSCISLLVVVLQIGWSAHALWSEAHRPYDAGQETAAFLTHELAGRRMAGFSFQTVSLHPYTDRNLFRNWQHRYWLWSNSNAIDLRLTEALQERPQVVVIGDQIQGQDTLDNQWIEGSPVGYRPALGLVDFWERHGYYETHRFCGVRVMRAGSDETTCELILEPRTR